MFELVDHRLRCRCNGGGHCGGAAEVIALQQVHAQTDDGAQLGLGLNALGNELHTAGVRVSHNVGDDLLLIMVSVDPAHNGNVDLDVPGRELQQVQLVAVAAAVVSSAKEPEKPGTFRFRSRHARSRSSCSVISTTSRLSSSG